MSAQEQMRQMLDQLMGTGRDGENNRFKVHFTDPRVCKSFLLGCCPHDILAATRMDLGECPRIHDLALRADYESASKKKDYYYDVDAMEHLQNFINECDRRTEQAKRRLAETQEELSSEVTLKLNRVHELAEQIGKKLAEAEKQGAEGNVEESLKLMEEVEEYRKQKATAEQDYRNSMPASSYQQQKLRVCEVCSAYLGIHDNDRRLADHFGGKLHLGFITIRERLDDLKKSVNERRQKARTERDREFDKEERDWRNKWPPVSRSRSRSRSQSRRHRSRSRSQERRHYRSRSRSHSPRSRHSSSHRSRSRDRKRRNHSRDRSRERKHHRSSERYKRRHSRDKERSSES
ncbi:putative RNA-binding protein Luc7-like 2 isoform X1 [Centruroides vittatus]|uniref:putative RNA-binding protein Luc7-like 2 isoform X1 n=2 Tax=Centruroides sculpturatus TaxID=218467 RepID=UPI000C6CADC9|nr:putative RNA-binding protein Luc7-like 2 isoform X1 [Centruroides sculpturatus]